MKYKFLVIAMVIAVISCSKKQNQAIMDTSSPYSIDFIEETSLMHAIDVAKQENKIIFLDLYTSWCLPCRMMKEEVYLNDDLGDYMNDNFVNLLIDAEKGKGPDIAYLYQANSFPTLLFIDTRGRVIKRSDSALSISGLKNLASEALLEIDSQDVGFQR